MKFLEGVSLGIRNSGLVFWNLDLGFVLFIAKVPCFDEVLYYECFLVFVLVVSDGDSFWC